VYLLRLAAFAALLASPAAAAASPIAEIICAPRDELAQRLTRQFGETRVATGMRDIERIMEVWTSERTGDWTLVMTYASGKSCIVAMGEHWQMDQPAAGEDPA